MTVHQQHDGRTVFDGTADARAIDPPGASASTSTSCPGGSGSATAAS